MKKPQVNGQNLGSYVNVKLDRKSGIHAKKRVGEGEAVFWSFNSSLADCSRRSRSACA